MAIGRERKARASAKLVHPDRLAEAVSRYVDWEAFAYWAGPALDRGSRLLAEVAAEVERRCPGFLDANINAREQDSSSASEDWPRLMLWIVDHFFQNAKAEGWCPSFSAPSALYPTGHFSPRVRFTKGHSLVSSGCNFLNSCSRDDGVNPLRVLVFVVAEYQRIEVPARWRVPANDEFVATVDSHLPPSARPLARLVAAVTAFRNQPFQSC